MSELGRPISELEEARIRVGGDLAFISVVKEEMSHYLRKKNVPDVLKRDLRFF